MQDRKLREILMVEDNAADVWLMREAFKEQKIHESLRVVRDGVQAIAYLRGKGNYAGAAVPDLILIDLNLPKKDGLELLGEIKAETRLMHIPVVILSTSSAEADVRNCYRQGANAYVQKPSDFNDLVKAVQSIESFWLVTAILANR